MFTSYQRFISYIYSLNALDRRNPYSIFFKEKDGIVKGYQMSIFGHPIFIITYNFRILGNASTDF